MDIKRLLATTALTALGVAPALSADMSPRPMPAAPAFVPAPVAFSWTGLYLGANLGAARHKSTLTDTGTGTLGPLFGPLGGIGNSVPAGPDFTNNSTGVIGGFQLGYNWQISSIVLGLEVDYSFSSAKSNTNIVPTFAPAGIVDTHNSKLNAVSTQRGRLGWAFDNWLIYGTGGAAYADLRNTFTENVDPLGTGGRKGVWGWTAGGGVEYALTNHWTLKGEYLHVSVRDFTQSMVFPVVAPSNYTFRFHDSIDIARVGINYKF